MDLKAVMNAPGDDDNASSDDDEEQEVAAIAQQQQQDEETAEALRAFRQSALHGDVNGIETESDDERRHRAVASAGRSRKLGDTLRVGAKTSSSPPATSGGRKKKTTPRLTPATLITHEPATSGDNTAPHKKRKRSDSAPEKSSTAAPESKAKVKVESRRSPAVAAAAQSEREGSSRMLRKISSSASDNGRDTETHKMKHEAPSSATPASTPGATSGNIPATQAFASPRDFFVAPADGSGDASHVVCTLCEVLIGSRVFTLKRHLFRHHPQVFRLHSENDKGHNETTGSAAVSTPRSSSQIKGAPVVKLKQEPSVALTPTGSSKKPLKRKSSNGGNVEFDAHGTFEKMNEAFVVWLQSDMIPMKALESALFHQFLSEINPHFTIPEVVVQPRKPLKTTTGDCDSMVKSEAARVMKGLCLQGNGKPPMLRTDLAIPVPKRGEALIKIVRAGICGTDLMMIDNYKPGFKGVIGHEFVGIVQQVGSHDGAATEQEWLGKRVVGEINIPCDTDACATCSRALTASHETSGKMTTSDSDAQLRQQVKRRNHCPHRAALGIVGKDGVFAEFITLPLANLHVVPEGVVDAHAVFAEPLAAACRILEQQTIQPHARVAILGDGKLGLLVAEVLHAQQQQQQQAEGGGANFITLIGKHREKLALMKHIVAHTLMLDDVTSDKDNMMMMMNYDVCVECTGTPTGMSLALQLLKRGGTLVMKSTCSIKKSPVDLPLVHAKQVEVIGSRCGPFDMAMVLLRDKKVDVQKFIHGVYPLERAEAALAHAAQRGTLKIQLVIA
ncbi:Glycoside hydrolase [Globisporangium polare]